jgi:predicted nucleic acid-binding protein
MKLVLDQAGVHALAGPATEAKRQVRVAMTAAFRTNRTVTIPTVILAELYRNSGKNQMIDAMLSREEEGIDLRNTDRALARLVGGVLSAAGAGTEDLADAHVVACAIESGGGVLMTVDEDDLSRLSAPYSGIFVQQLSSP